jgi:hypothetical protein
MQNSKQNTDFYKLFAAPIELQVTELSSNYATKEALKQHKLHPENYHGL